ncbi:MAG: sulfurtransferase TusA family protein [Pseudomonadota bacterium]
MSETAAGRLPEWLTADRVLDVSGSLCPIPVIEAGKALKEMRGDQVLEVIATDPLAELDLAVMCEHLGHGLIASANEGARIRVQIRVV